MPPEEAEANAGRTVEHLFRQESGKIIASLTGALGLRYLELAEDALQEAQVALTLKTLCGFGVGEIARAFLATDETIAKRLARARTRLRSAGVRFEIPDGRELSGRLDAVLDVLYLLFNEGYNASHGSDLIRRDLCDEAIRLATLMTGNAATDTPKTRALLALFFLQAARFPARLNAIGELYLLEEQDRSRWDREMIAKGLAQLESAAAGDRLSPFHLQAGIAACHTVAPTYQATDWAQILSLYDLLLQMTASPIAALNRAVALAKVRGAGAGLEELARIKGHHRLQRYYLYYAVRAEFCSELGRQQEAADDYRRALGLTELEAERRFLRGRLERIQPAI